MFVGPTVTFLYLFYTSADHLYVFAGKVVKLLFYSCLSLMVYINIWRFIIFCAFPLQSMMLVVLQEEEEE